MLMRLAMLPTGKEYFRAKILVSRVFYEPESGSNFSLKFGFFFGTRMDQN